jgi:DNA-binding SARP family transcriptional activator
MNLVCHKYLNQNILPFAGRDAHLAALRSQFDLFANEGLSSYSLIAGSIGIGKSRLVRELEQSLTKEFGDEVVLVHARYLEGNVAALTPILNAFAASISHHHVIREVLEKLPETGAIASGHVESSSDMITLQLLLDAAREIGKRFALVIVMEDLHNLDDLMALDQLLLGLATVPKHVIFSYRVEEDVTRSRTVETFVRQIALRDEASLKVIQIDALSEDDIKELFQILFEIEASQALTFDVQNVTQGKPLELRTMLRGLISQGVLEYDQGIWSEASHPTIIPPVEEDHGIKSRFEQELARLSKDEQIAIMHAAWLGEQFDVRLLRQLLESERERSGFDSALFDRVIQLLSFKSIIRKAVPSIYFAPRGERGPETPNEGELAANCYEFSHPHFWNTVLTASKSYVNGRHDIVLMIAETAEKDQLPLYSSNFLSISGSPFHLVSPEESKQTVSRFLGWSAAVASALWSLEPAQTLRFLLAVRPIRDDITWRLASELDEASVRALLDLYSMLIEALMRSGSHPEAEKELENAAVLEKFISARAAKGDFTESFHQLARGKVYCLRAMVSISKGRNQDFEKASEIAYDALLTLNSDAIERARLLSMLARAKADTLLVAGHLQEADQLLENNLEIAKQLADTRPDEHSQFYRLAVNSKLKQGKDREARQLIEQIIAQARLRRDAITETTFLYQAAVAAFSSGDVVEAMRYADQGIVYGRRYGIRFAEVMSNIWRMIIAGVQHDDARVQECITNLDAILASSGNLLWKISYIESRATTMNFLSKHEEALEQAEEAIRLADNNEYRSFAAWAHNEKGLALNGLARYSEALSTATNCLLLLGQQLMAERTARTVLVGALAGHFEWSSAEQELQRVKALTTERSPYYYRIIQAEARLVRSMLSSPDFRDKRFETRNRLKAIVQEMIDLSRQWQAPKLEKEITNEFREFAPSISIYEQVVEQAVLKREVAPSRFRLHTLGSFYVEDLESKEEEAAQRKGRDSKVRTLIGMLLVARIEGRTLSKENLADSLWPDSSFDAQLAALHTSIKRARAFIGGTDTISFNEGSYELSNIVSSDIEDLMLEADDVRQIARRGASFSVAIRYERLIKGLGHGRFLEGVDADWVDGVRSRVDSLKRTAIERLLNLNIDRSAYDRAESLCQELLLEDEFDSLAIKSLLSIAAKKQQASKVKGIYENYAAKYRKEFKSEPDPAIKRLADTLAVG